MSKPILIEVSARHAHVTQETLKILFGPDAELTIKKDLSQPGQYASNQKIDIVGPKKTITGVSILGPVRTRDQVEVSATDARTLGVDAPIRESGDVDGSAPLKLIGPYGAVEIKEGCIVAKRHIHLRPIDAQEQGVSNGDIVSVKVDSPLNRSLIFGDVVIRVSDKFAPAMHIDTDEGNAVGLKGVVYGTIVK